MTPQAPMPPGPRTAHPNALLIEALYTAIRNADPTAIAACYHGQAYFQDIAFRRHGKEKVTEMWRYVCHAAPKVTFDAYEISADDRTGSGRWRAIYMFGETDTKSGRPVDNTLSSTFVFRDGLIVEHRDWCDAMAWARQAFPFPINLVAGSIAPLRRCIASLKLRKFSKGATK